MSPTSVHAEPFQDSAKAELGAGGAFPPIAKAAVDVPNPPKSPLPVFKSATSDAEEPSNNSVNPVYVAGE